MFSFSRSDKVLVVAPHPDDESLGTGGLLQRLFAKKIPVRILFATSGENNPWAQRYWERRWRIGAEDRARWGRHRRAEAINAIGVLGGQPDCARFLNLPDLGTTDLLMRGGAELPVLISNEVQEWEPTVAFIPTTLDAHPDHSALSVAFSMAFDSVEGSRIRAWEYLVHKPQVPIGREPVKIYLRAEEVARKRRAILCHETQVALSRSRFTDFARFEETYYPHPPAEAKKYEEPLISGRLHEGILSLQFKVSRGERLHSEILLAFRSGSENEHRWRFPVPVRSARGPIWDTIRGRPLHEAISRWGGRTLSVDVPLPVELNFDTIYAKLSGPTLFFDRSGWSQFRILAGRAQSHLQRANVPRLVTLS
jgi:LmbE family N-acetylglucosaminyl deacetylase